MLTATILIVEDNELNLQLATDLLEAKGFLVFQARTAEEGLRLARQVHPNLILMDLSLPGMDGLCAASALKADPVTSAITTVALTAHAMKGDEEIAKKAGCDGYLTKPIDTRTFVNSISQILHSTTCLQTQAT